MHVPLTIGSEAYIKVQSLLALHLYGDQYNSDTRLNTEDRKKNPDDIRVEATKLWGKSFSGLFEEYIRSHPGLDVNLSDKDDVDDLFNDFNEWQKKKRDTLEDLDRNGLTN